MKLGPKMAVSRVFWSKNLKPVVVSLKPGVFGGVGGLTPGWARGPERTACFSVFLRVSARRLFGAERQTACGPKLAKKH